MPVPATGVPSATTAGQFALMPAGTVLVVAVPSGSKRYTVIPAEFTRICWPIVELSAAETVALPDAAAVVAAPPELDAAVVAAPPADVDADAAAVVPALPVVAEELAESSPHAARASAATIATATPSSRLDTTSLRSVRVTSGYGRGERRVQSDAVATSMRSCGQSFAASNAACAFANVSDAENACAG